MKTNLIICLALLAINAKAQTAINKTIPARSGQTITMNFDYPELIKVSTWDKNEILIQGEVSINGGEHDDAFELITSSTGNAILIENKIKNMKSLPQMITVMDGTQKITFKSKEDFKKYKGENGADYERVSWGLDMDITLEIKVPQGMETTINSTYGMVEVSKFMGPIGVVAKYGGIDATLNEKLVGELSAETNYGQIYSNLDTRFNADGLREKDFYTFVTVKPGSGPRYEFQSKYGNVYLRKTN